MDGDHFNPHGFGLLPTVALAAATAVTAQSIADNLATAVEEYRNADNWDRINQTVTELLQENARLQLQTADWAAALETIGQQFKVMSDLAVRQATQLKALRDAGIID